MHFLNSSIDMVFSFPFASIYRILYAGNSHHATS